MQDADCVPSGLPSLDYILGGGYAFNCTHLIEGQPGSGKTTLALQFLIEGRDRGERCIYITLSETAAELRHVAATHGLSLEGIDFFELLSPGQSVDVDQPQSVLYASDLELGETVRSIMDAVRYSRPNRAVFDSSSEIRLLAQGPLTYRRQVLALKQFFFQQKCTILFLDDLTSSDDDLTLHSVSHCVIRFEQLALPYGAERRRLRVYKMRARSFRGGFHDFVIRKGGVRVFPRLVAADHESIEQVVDQPPIPSGVSALDDLLGGGLDLGTTTLIQGPAGSGKSTLALQFLKAELERGKKALFISFDETQRNFLRRATGMGMNIQAHLAEGRLVFLQIDPAEISPGELSDIIRSHVAEGTIAVALDSLSGYQHAVPEESFLLLQMHELSTYLNQRGVMTVLVLAEAGVVGTMHSPFDMSYLADTLLLLRFFEATGQIRRALSVVKKRTGAHERTIRELFFDNKGVQVGPALDDFRGVLSGAPLSTGNDPFLGERDPELRD